MIFIYCSFINELSTLQLLSLLMFAPTHSLTLTACAVPLQSRWGAGALCSFYWHVASERASFLCAHGLHGKRIDVIIQIHTMMMIFASTRLLLPPTIEMCRLQMEIYYSYHEKRCAMI